MIATKMEAETSGMKLWQSQADKFTVDMCIICQKATDDATVSTLNGKKRIRDAADIRNEAKHLKLFSSTDEHFVYHMTSSSYKTYTKKSTLKKKK